MPLQSPLILDVCFIFLINRSLIERHPDAPVTGVSLVTFLSGSSNGLGRKDSSINKERAVSKERFSDGPTSISTKFKTSEILESAIIRINVLTRKGGLKEISENIDKHRSLINFTMDAARI